MKTLTAFIVLLLIISCEQQSPKDELMANELIEASPYINSVILVNNGINIFNEPTNINNVSYIEMNIHDDHLMFIKYYNINNHWQTHKYTVFYTDITQYSMNNNCLTIFL
jgi:hypothetical protein